ncbi:hypothetical protein ACIB24_02650 [Spongisporangium articulatum]|uniref:Uncharacterized protein n=1 Tax=Spongisporangium articulatum TaxID=3362603 RepID=A0ABW8AHX3_9ACTN
MRRALRLTVEAVTVLACSLLGGALPGAVAATTPVKADTVLSSKPKAFSSTDGDILTVVPVRGASVASIAIGGNFRHVRQPDGRSVAARNFAILDAKTGAVRFAGQVDSYVRSITSRDGVTYLGGDFTWVGGKYRPRAAAVSATGSVTAWNPRPPGRVRALAADKTGVYLAGDFNAVRKVSLSTGGTLWAKTTTAGLSRTLLLTGGSLYVGGLFESYDGLVRHGLVKVAPGSGAVDAGFDAKLRADSGTGPYPDYDGEGVASLAAAPTKGNIVVGVGGHAPPGPLVSNEVFELKAATGGKVWRKGLIGDGQAVAAVGKTVVVGYHRNLPNTTVPWPYFAAQFNDAKGSLTTWDPKLTGDQSNADGGNNGVQAMYANATAKRLFVAGAFTAWNGKAGYQSLAVFSWT